MKLELISLKNGIRILHKEVKHTHAIHAGLIMNTGSRDESFSEMGIAHFTEHMIFKGTRKRKTFQVLNYLESVGGDLDAYTTKEKTCVYASLSADHVERAFDLITDITFNSTFPEKEILKERQVISEEIDMYRDNPEEAIFEDFDKLIFPDHPLGNPILGSKESIKEVTRKGLKKFVGEKYAQDRVVFCTVGNVPFKKIKALANKYLADIELGPQFDRKVMASSFEPGISTQKVHTQQAHFITGGRAYAVREGLYLPFFLLNNQLGGPAMSSKLNLNIREKHGLSYNIYSFYQPYSDYGFWGIYFACEKENLERIENLVGKELKQMRSKKPGTLVLSQMKKQLIGQLTLKQEQLTTQMMATAKNHLDFGRDFDFKKMAADIEKVTASEILESANEIMNPDLHSSLSYLPRRKSNR